MYKCTEEDCGTAMMMDSITERQGLISIGASGSVRKQRR